VQEVCYNIAVESPLLPLSGETIVPASMISSDGACADVRATGFWGRHQSAFLDIRVFHPNAPSYLRTHFSGGEAGAWCQDWKC